MEIVKHMLNITNEHCPQCGSPVIPKINDHNAFVSCIMFPKCVWLREMTPAEIEYYLDERIAELEEE